MPLETKDDFQGEYLTLQHQLIKDIDAAYGIVSQFKKAKNKARFPTGIYWKRNATKAKPYYCGDADDSVVKNNLLLRLLATTRGIDYMLQKRAELYPNYAKKYQAERVALKTLYAEYQAKIQAEEAELNQLEREYNFALVKLLHVNCLDFGLKTTKDYQKLLLHYRCLASALDPAPSVQTVIKDVENNVTHIETAHPITEKTPEQLAALQEMGRVALKPLPEQKNYHTVQKCAFQEASMVFAELLQQPNRRLPAQSRKTVAPTVKNGYLTRYRIERNKEFLGECWALRAGTAVYVGRGEFEESLVKHAEGNFQQMMLLAGKMMGADNLHITLLNTLSPFSRQHIMVRITDQARKALGYNISYIPLNLDGTFRITEISSLVRNNNHQLVSKSHPWDKSKRLTTAVSIAKTLYTQHTLRSVKAVKADEEVEGLDKKITVNLVTCASGQDRTGTLCEASAIQFAYDVYQEKLPDVAADQQTMERLRARGMHNAFLATFAAPGSLGMKKESQAGDYFSDATNKQFYLQTARTNSSCPIEAAAVKQIKKVKRHVWALHGLPRVSSLWHDWRRESVREYLDTPRLSDTKKLDTLIEQFKLMYEAKPGLQQVSITPAKTAKDLVQSDEKVESVLSASSGSVASDTTDVDLYKKTDTERLLEHLHKIETVANKWLASDCNSLFSDRVQAVKNLKRNVAIEKYLLEDPAEFETKLNDKLTDWSKRIHNWAPQTNSSGIKTMFKLMQNVKDINALSLTQKIVLLKRLQEIADDRLEKNFFKQLYCKASFFGEGRQASIQTYYEKIQASEFLTSNLPRARVS